ncbi:MAG: RDD family protein [Saprospiraceae bacterium]
MTILDQPNSFGTQHSSEPLVYASFGERFAARIIDGLILVIPSFFIPFIVGWLYYAIQEGGESGATIGKRAMNIRVVSEGGQRIGFGTATGRFFGHILNMFTFFIGYLLMFFNARSQCLHDMITGTVVIKDGFAYREDSLAYREQRAAVSEVQNRAWTAKVSDVETHFVEINELGGSHWHRSPMGEQVNHFTLWQLTDGLVDFSPEFGAEAFEEMKQHAEGLMRSRS